MVLELEQRPIRNQGRKSGSEHIIPTYSPHLNPIERLWGVMHRNVTHHKCYATFRDFNAATMAFLTQDVPTRWDTLRDSATDNFRIIDPSEYRVPK